VSSTAGTLLFVVVSNENVHTFSAFLNNHYICPNNLCALSYMSEILRITIIPCIPYNKLTDTFVNRLKIQFNKYYNFYKIIIVY